MPGIIAKPTIVPYRKGALKRLRVPADRKCRGELLRSCRKKPFRRLPGTQDWLCHMHYMRWWRHADTTVSLYKRRTRGRIRRRKAERTTTQ